MDSETSVYQKSGFSLKGKQLIKDITDLYKEAPALEDWIFDPKRWVVSWADREMGDSNSTNDSILSYLAASYKKIASDETISHEYKQEIREAIGQVMEEVLKEAGRYFKPSELEMFFDFNKSTMVSETFEEIRSISHELYSVLMTHTTTTRFLLMLDKDLKQHTDSNKFLESSVFGNITLVLAVLFSPILLPISAVNRNLRQYICTYPNVFYIDCAANSFTLLWAMILIQWASLYWNAIYYVMLVLTLLVLIAKIVYEYDEYRQHRGIHKTFKHYLHYNIINNFDIAYVCAQIVYLVLTIIDAILEVSTTTSDILVPEKTSFHKECATHLPVFSFVNYVRKAQNAREYNNYVPCFFVMLKSEFAKFVFIIIAILFTRFFTLRKRLGTLFDACLRLLIWGTRYGVIIAHVAVGAIVARNILITNSNTLARIPILDTIKDELEAAKTQLELAIEIVDDIADKPKHIDPDYKFWIISYFLEGLFLKLIAVNGLIAIMTSTIGEDLLPETQQLRTQKAKNVTFYAYARYGIKLNFWPVPFNIFYKLFNKDDCQDSSINEQNENTTDHPSRYVVERYLDQRRLSDRHIDRVKRSLYANKVDNIIKLLNQQ